MRAYINSDGRIISILNNIFYPTILNDFQIDCHHIISIACLIRTLQLFIKNLIVFSFYALLLFASAIVSLFPIFQMKVYPLQKEVLIGLAHHTSNS